VTKKVVPDDMQAQERREMQYKTPEELREDARVYLSRLLAGYPDSAFRKRAQADLQTLGGPLSSKQ